MLTGIPLPLVRVTATMLSDVIRAKFRPPQNERLLVVPFLAVRDSFRLGLESATVCLHWLTIKIEDLGLGRCSGWNLGSGLGSQLHIG